MDLHRGRCILFFSHEKAPGRHIGRVVLCSMLTGEAETCAPRSCLQFQDRRASNRCIINNNTCIIRCWLPRRGKAAQLSILQPPRILPPYARSGVTRLGGARAALQYQPVGFGAFASARVVYPLRCVQSPSACELDLCSYRESAPRWFVRHFSCTEGPAHGEPCRMPEIEQKTPAVRGQPHRATSGEPGHCMRPAPVTLVVRLV